MVEAGTATACAYECHLSYECEEHNKTSFYPLETITVFICVFLNRWEASHGVLELQILRAAINSSLKFNQSWKEWNLNATRWCQFSWLRSQQSLACKWHGDKFQATGWTTVPSVSSNAAKVVWLCMTCAPLSLERYNYWELFLLAEARKVVRPKWTFWRWQCTALTLNCAIWPLCSFL